MKPIFVLNGPNLNTLGDREPGHYGMSTLSDIERDLARQSSLAGFALVFRQTNHEGVLVDWVQEAKGAASALILNAAAYTHTSIAVLDALRLLTIPVIEVHLSNVFQRENFRHRSYVSRAATGLICGFGAKSYSLAMSAALALVAETPELVASSTSSFEEVHVRSG